VIEIKSMSEVDPMCSGCSSKRATWTYHIGSSICFSLCDDCSDELSLISGDAGESHRAMKQIDGLVQNWKDRLIGPSTK